MSGPLTRLMRMIGAAGAYVPTGDSFGDRQRKFHRQRAHFRPRPYLCNAAVLEQEPALGLGAPTVAWADAALRQMKRSPTLLFPQDSSADFDGRRRPRRSGLHAGHRASARKLLRGAPHLIIAGAKA